MDPVLSVSDLTVAFGGDDTRSSGSTVISHADLTLSAGRVTGVAGESGSGKTMTGMAIMGLLPAGARTTGRISLDGNDLLSLPEARMNAIRGRDIGMVFQDPSTSLHPMLRVGTQLTDHMRHHLRISRREALEKAADLLHTVRIPDPKAALRAYPHQFSGGMRQRIAIAIAIACDPKVVVADEPTTALDVTVQASVLRLLRRLCDDLGIAIMLITHDFGVMSAIADEVVVMRHGRVVETGNRFDVITRPQHAYTQELIAALPGTHIERRAENGGSAVS